MVVREHSRYILLLSLLLLLLLLCFVCFVFSFIYLLFKIQFVRQKIDLVGTQQLGAFYKRIIRYWLLRRLRS